MNRFQILDEEEDTTVRYDRFVIQKVQTFWPKLPVTDSVDNVFAERVRIFASVGGPQLTDVSELPRLSTIWTHHGTALKCVN